MIRLLHELWVVSGEQLTHPWDANAYLVNGAEPTLIDCGSTLGYPQLRGALGRFGLEPRDIKRVIATHGHWDHVSAVSLLQQEGNCEFYIHDAEKRQVETGDEEMTAAFLYRQPFPPVRVDGTLTDGQVLNINGVTFTVLHTPGHSPGSVCFLVSMAELGLLIAGDTAWGGYHPRIGSDMERWIVSLDRLLAEDFDAAAIGHGPPGLVFGAKRKMLVARERFGLMFDPWFRLDSVS